MRGEGKAGEWEEGKRGEERWEGRGGEVREGKVVGGEEWEES